MGMYEIKAKTTDEDWPAGFHYAIELICENTLSNYPPDLYFEINRFALDALNELKKTRDYDDKRIYKIIEAYPGHYHYSKRQIIDDYENLALHMHILEPETKIRAHGGYAASIMLGIGVLLFIFAVLGVYK